MLYTLTYHDPHDPHGWGSHKGMKSPGNSEGSICIIPMSSLLKDNCPLMVAWRVLVDQGLCQDCVKKPCVVQGAPPCACVSNLLQRLEGQLPEAFRNLIACRNFFQAVLQVKIQAP